MSPRLSPRSLVVASLVGTVLLLLASPAHEAHAQAASVAVGPTAVRGDTTVTLRDFGWLAGRWEGTMASIPGSAGEVTFSAPKAGLMTGMMRLARNDTVLVVELISLVDTPLGIEMRFRHFSPTLVAYEREFRQAMRLTKHESRADTFENTVAYDAALMSTQPRRTAFLRRGDDEYVGRSDIIGADGKPAVVESTYRREPK